MGNVDSDGWERLTYTLDMFMGFKNEVEEWFN